MCAFDHTAFTIAGMPHLRGLQWLHPAAEALVRACVTFLAAPRGPPLVICMAVLTLLYAMSRLTFVGEGLRREISINIVLLGPK